MTPQNRQIANHLTRHGRLTPLEALNKYGVMRLGARIWELKREHGMAITRVLKTVRTRSGDVTRVAEYRLGN